MEGGIGTPSGGNMISDPDLRFQIYKVYFMII